MMIYVWDMFREVLSVDTHAIRRWQATLRMLFTQLHMLDMRTAQAVESALQKRWCSGMQRNSEVLVQEFLGGIGARDSA